MYSPRPRRPAAASGVLTTPPTKGGVRRCTTEGHGQPLPPTPTQEAMGQDQTMDTLSTQGLTSQLADDLGFLEKHARDQPDQEHMAGRLRLAAALVRNCL